MGGFSPFGRTRTTRPDSPSPARPARRRHRRWSLATGTVVLTSLVGSLVVLPTRPAGAVPSSFLELDSPSANIRSDGGLDWALSNGTTGTNGVFSGGVFNGTTTPPTAPATVVSDPSILSAEFFVDPLSSDVTSCGTGDPTVFTGAGGEKNGQLLSGMTFGTASVPNKDDLSNVYALSRLRPDNAAEVFFGAERIVNNGDSHVDFEFFQSGISIPSACAGSFSGNRSHGDLLLAVDFTNGGALDTFQLYEWHCVVEGGAQPADGTVCNPPANGPSVPHYQPITTSAAVTLRVNSAGAVPCGGWVCRDSSGAQITSVPTNAFIEGGIDLDALGFTGCISTFLPHTRSSQQFTATLKDFVRPIPVNTCVAPTITTTSNPNLTQAGTGDHVTPGSSVTDTVTVTGPSGPGTGTVQFSLCGPLATATGCASGGTPVGGAITLSGGTATSPAFNVTGATAAGFYCWRADYTPVAGNHYLAGSHTNTRTECFEVVPVADLQIVKTDTPDPIALGAGNVSYTLTVTNNGPSPATGVVVTDTLPASFTYVSATPSQGSCTPPAGSVLTCTLGNLAVGASATIAVVVTPTAAGTFDNVASVVGNEEDSNLANNSDTEPTTVTAVIDLSVTKSDSPDPINLGAGNVTYTLNVGNAGPSPATGVTVTDTLPASFTYVSSTPSQGSCAYNAGPHTVTCNLGGLGVGSSASISIVVTPTVAGTFTNNVSVTGTETDSNLANNTDSEPTTVVPVADLQVTKADTPDPIALGTGNVSYTLTVTNNGPSPATGVTAVDTLPASFTYVSSTPSQGTCGHAAGVVTCNLGGLGIGSSATITVVVTPTVAGTFDNTVVVDGNEDDSNPANNTDVEPTTVTPVADLQIVKTDNPDPIVLGAGNLSYLLTITNNGPSPATGVTVVDTLPGSVTYVSATPSQGTCGQAAGIITCDLGGLAVGASATITIVVTPTQAGEILNTATVDGNEEDRDLTNNTDDEPTVVGTSADLQVVKTDTPDPIALGAGNVTYTLTVTNNGPSPATGVVVTDTLPAEFTYASATPSQGTCGEASGVITCNLGNMASGGGATITVVVTPTVAGTFDNTVVVDGNEPDPNLDNNTDVEPTTVTPVADLQVVKVDTPDPIILGSGNVTYTLTVTNNGPSPATGVVATDTLPAEFTYVSATPSQGSCGEAAGVITCTLGGLGIGSSATITVVVTPTVVGTFDNTVVVDGNEDDSNPANNTDVEPTTVTAVADLEVTKSDDPDPIALGSGNVTYTLTVTNNGPSPATGVVATDTLPASFTFVSATPSQGSCSESDGAITCTLGGLASGASATITVVVTPTEAGTFENVVVVGGDQDDSNPDNNTDTEPTTVTPVADVGIVKTDTPDPITLGTGNIAYTLLVTNHGPSPATNVVVTDVLPSTVTFVSAVPSQGTCLEAPPGLITCSLGNLAVGGIATITVIVTPTVAGTLTNTAGVDADEPDNNPANDSDTETTEVISVLPAVIPPPPAPAPAPPAPAPAPAAPATLAKTGADLATQVANSLLLLLLGAALVAMEAASRRRSRLLVPRR